MGFRDLGLRVLGLGVVASLAFLRRAFKTLLYVQDSFVSHVAREKRSGRILLLLLFVLLLLRLLLLILLICLLRLLASSSASGFFFFCLS